MGLEPHPSGAYDAPDDLTEFVEPDDLVYFQLNIGDADAALIVLPQDATGRRDIVVVDAGRVYNSKLPKLIRALSDDALHLPLLDQHTRIRLVVATHPHDDHIGGIPNLLESVGDLLEPGGEVWDPAFYYRNDKWHAMMHWLEDHPAVPRLHPSSGTRRHIGASTITALAPSVQLRNNFDTRGTHVNNASITTLIEFPMRPVFADKADDAPIGAQPAPYRRRQLLLGADAQAVSWAHVEVEFPSLAADHAPEHRLLGQADGREPLRADVFKVPHHASKLGLNLELVKRINPLISLVSCDAHSGHGFPHDVALDQLREGLQAIAGSGGAKHRSSDLELGIFGTGDVDEHDNPLGTIALVIPPTGTTMQTWRLRDQKHDQLTVARLSTATKLTEAPTRAIR